MSLSNEMTTNFLNMVINDSGVTVIRQKQEGASPSKPYASYRYISNIGIGHPTTIYTDPGGTQKLVETNSRLRTPQLEVQFYTKTETQALTENIEDYKSAADYCSDFEDDLTSLRVQRFMRENDFSVLSKTSIPDLDSQLGDSWERRSQCEMTLNQVTSTTDNVEYFNQSAFNVELTIEDI